jgi:hypothetical protein
VIADDPVMDRVGRWYSERPRRSPAEYALELTRLRGWRDVERSFIESVDDLWELDEFLNLDSELAHAFVFVLSTQPAARRRDYAERFYSERTGDRRSTPDLVSRAAAVASMVLPLTGRADLDNDRVADLLTAIEQGDDLTLTPPGTIAELQKAVARARLDLDLDDQLAPHAAATTAVVEMLDSSSDLPATLEILMRATWAVLETSGAAVAIDFLLAVDALSARADRRR